MWPNQQNQLCKFDLEISLLSRRIIRYVTYLREVIYYFSTCIDYGCAFKSKQKPKVIFYNLDKELLCLFCYIGSFIRLFIISFILFFLLLLEISHHLFLLHFGSTVEVIIHVEAFWTWNFRMTKDLMDNFLVYLATRATPAHMHGILYPQFCLVIII